MDNDDIDDWIDLLADKPGVKATAAQAAEIALVQAAIRDHTLHEAQAAPPGAADELAEARAWQKIRAQLDVEPSSGPTRANRRVWPAVATAAVLVLGVSVTWRALLSPDEEAQVLHQLPPQYHGSVPLLDVADAAPLERARRLARRLQSEATRPTIYYLDGQATVEIEITAAHLATITRVLAQDGIPATGLTPGIAQISIHLP